ncbi:MAG: endonuclease III [Clostridia bacterium]|nr:endonuclease III [Clostridia bacterium]
MRKESVKNLPEILRILEEKYPDAACSLEAGEDPWRLLVMARLSAQCMDACVNRISPALFQAFPTPKAMAKADVAEIERLIRPCGLFRTKANSIREMSRVISEEYGGRVPDTMEELLALPGVGRKIANLILGDVFGKGGIVADTHCIRIVSRLGFTPEGCKDPLRTERTMDPLIDRKDQAAFCHRLVLFGREICTAKAPRCLDCPLSRLCPERNCSP